MAVWNTQIIFIDICTLVNMGISAIAELKIGK